MSDDVHSSCLALFKGWVARSGASTALRFFDGVVSYAELDQRSDDFALLLLDKGFAAGDRAAIILQNIPSFIIAVLGIWKAGGSAVPVNPMYRAREVEIIFNDSMPKIVITTLDIDCDVLSKISSPTKILVDAREFQTVDDPRAFSSAILDLPRLDSTERDHAAMRRLIVDPEPEDLAYIVYTSGTSGVPKGVRLLHKNIEVGVATSIETFNVDPGSTILAMAPLFHVSGLMQHLGLALCSGSVLVLLHRFEPSLAVEAVRKYAVTHISGASTAFIAMMNTPGAAPGDMRSIATIVTGGAPTAPAVLDQIEMFFGVKPMNAYGLTETGIASHLTPRDQDIPVDEMSGAISVGKPNVGFRAIVVDEAGTPVAPGDPGEIVVSGPSVAAGYWRKPDETAAAFRSAGFFTGDTGRVDENGWFYIIDRKKDMISASGFKVWPREVEDVLYSHPAVREAAVVGVPDAYRGENVKAVVSLKDGYLVSPNDLSLHCRERLAAYKCPRLIDIVADLPKTPSGKILRREIRS